MRNCPKCRRSNPEGAMFCDCGSLLIAEPDMEKRRVEEPGIPSPRPSPRSSSEAGRYGRRITVNADPVLTSERAKRSKGWEVWLPILLVLVASRLFINRMWSPTPPSDRSLSKLTGKPLIPDFSLSYQGGQTARPSSPQTSRPQRPSPSWDGQAHRQADSVAPGLRAALDRLPPEERDRFERLDREAGEIALKYLTREEYEFISERTRGRSQGSLTREELDRIASLTKKLDSMTTADEKKTMAEANEMYRRLVDPGR
jgi:hypothetical protein